MPSPILAVELYTVRDLCKADYAQTLKQVATSGYRAVELAGTYGHKPVEVKRMADDVGLIIISSHVGLVILETNLEAVLDDHAVMGCQHLAVPSIPRERIQNKEGWLNVARSLNQLAQQCQTRGVTLSYHNHAYELETKIDGHFALDALFTHAPHAQTQLDVYWIWKGGADPATYLRQYKNRAPTLHLKDANKSDGSDAEVGSGQLDWQAILSAAKEAGTWGYIIEQDYPKGSPLDCLKRSFEFLKAQGLS